MLARRACISCGPSVGIKVVCEVPDYSKRFVTSWIDAGDPHILHMCCTHIQHLHICIVLCTITVSTHNVAYGSHCSGGSPVPPTATFNELSSTMHRTVAVPKLPCSLGILWHGYAVHFRSWTWHSYTNLLVKIRRLHRLTASCYRTLAPSDCTAIYMHARHPKALASGRTSSTHNTIALAYQTCLRHMHHDQVVEVFSRCCRSPYSHVTSQGPGTAFRW